jgi:hypothetical protein
MLVRENDERLGNINIIIKSLGERIRVKKRNMCIYFRLFESENVQALSLVVKSICQPRVVRLPNISLPWEKSSRMASKMHKKKYDIYI